MVYEDYLIPSNKKLGFTINKIPEKHAKKDKISLFPIGSLKNTKANKATITHDNYLKTKTSPIGYT